MEIRLNKSSYKGASNKNMNLPIDLVGNNKVLPIEPFNAQLSELDVYNNERRACNNIRLTLGVNVVASNILCNYITEIVKNEGSKDVILYNVDGIGQEERNEIWAKKWVCFDREMVKNVPTPVGMENNYRLTYQAVRDTQLSSEKFGYEYHCGMDIFNNHILRSKTFKAVCPFNSKGGYLKQFNTIEDLLRDGDGNQVRFYNDKIGSVDNKPTLNAHLYLDEEVMSYPESIKENLIEYNGWFGFKNVEKFPMYSGKTPYDFSKTINNRKACDFIDMYPTRDLFYFTPKFNPYRRRIEKNWNYCLTYPSSSTTEGIVFIREATNSLKIFTFDEFATDKGGGESIKFNSICKHGLKVDDYVNIYSGDEVIIEGARVIRVDGDYSFYIVRNGMTISKKWIVMDDYTDVYSYSEEDESGNTTTYTYNYPINDRSRKYVEENIVVTDASGNTISSAMNKVYTVDRNKVNIDGDNRDISFKKTFNGKECEYYVRIFSKIPNWRFAAVAPTNDPKEIKKYQAKEYDFESHIGKLAFSRNIYNDEYTEVVYTDNINLEGLLDNLGRPVTDIFFTVIKNNSGYREWYGKKYLKYGKPYNLLDHSNDQIEYSHCFGKNTCAFRLSDLSIANDDLPNIITINNVGAVRGDTHAESGMAITINERDEYLRGMLDDDEIEYNSVEYYYNSSDELKKTYGGDVNFFGDLCCYSKYDCLEETIQPIEFRFNTVQREIQNFENANEGEDGQNFALENYFKKYVWDEIKKDDFDGMGNNNFQLEAFKSDPADEDGIANYCDSCGARKEGYCYVPHTKISIKTLSSYLESAYPIFYSVKQIKNLNTYVFGKGYRYTISFMNNIQMPEGTKFEIFDKVKKLRYDCIVDKIENLKNASIYAKLNEKDLPDGYVIKGEDRRLIEEDAPRRYKLYVRYDEEIPFYATFINDGSCRFVWRNVLQNGFDDNSPNEVYPFANNALYVEKNINIFVKRQDPRNIGNLWANQFPYDFNSRGIPQEDYDNFVQDVDIQC